MKPTKGKSMAKCFVADNEFDRIVGPVCAGETLSQLATGHSGRVMPGWLREAHEAEVAHHQTAGVKLAGAERAYGAARAEWLDLPDPVFDELAQEGLRLMSEGTWEASLAEYVEAALESKLGADLLVTFHGRNARCMVKAQTKFGGRWLTAADGAMGKSMREVLMKLWAVAPEPTEAETLESAALLEQEVAR